jgi:hypothetical protein|tara:strand:+ start:2051 stop:2263 length:213 start_codon:yes stop_codon:yes gene_type:complete
MKASFQRGSSLCEEFSDFVLYDNEFDSILVNVHEDYFGTVFRELGKLGYVLVFRTKLQTTNSLTCTFIRG